MENNNEFINEGMEVIIEDVVADEATGMNPGVAVLIVAGVAAAVGAGVVLAKKAYAAHKAKKELRKPDAEVLVEPEDLEDVAAK